MEISKKWLYVYMAVFTVALCFAWTANAAVLTSYTAANNTLGYDNSSAYLVLGTGLTGTPSAVQIYASSSIASLITATVKECHDVDYVSCFTYAAGTSVIPSAPVGYLSLPVTATTSMKSTKWYYVAFSHASGRVDYYGASSDPGAPGRGCVNVPTTAGACSVTFAGAGQGSLSGMWFLLLDGNSIAPQNQIIAIISPTNQNTTQSTTVTFSYTYSNASAYTRASFVLKDLTSNESLNTNYASSTITSTGNHIFTYADQLISGHLYQWQPYIYTTDNSLPAIYGTTQTFFVVTTSNYQSLYTQQATSANPFATSTIYTCWTTNSCFAHSATSSFQYSTSSVTARCAIRSLPDVVATQMAIKMPFSYICDIALLMTELAYGNGTYVGNIVAALPNSFHGSTTNVTMLDQTAIAGLGELGSIKQLMKYTVYFMTALAIISMALGAL